MCLKFKFEGRRRSIKEIRAMYDEAVDFQKKVQNELAAAKKQCGEWQQVAQNYEAQWQAVRKQLSRKETATLDGRHRLPNGRFTR